VFGGCGGPAPRRIFTFIRVMIAQLVELFFLVGRSVLMMILSLVPQVME